VRALLERLSGEPAAALTELLELMAVGGAVDTGEAGGAGVSVFELLNSGAWQPDGRAGRLRSSACREHSRAVVACCPVADAMGSAGVVRALSDYLMGADLDASQQGEARATAILRRQAQLARAGLAPNPSISANPPLAGFVRKLQAALASTETFHVFHARGPSAAGASRLSFARGASAASGTGGSLSNGLSLLTHPLKLRLSRIGADASLRDYATNIVLIEPLATMQAIEVRRRCDLLAKSRAHELQVPF
jgi:hypothetical protein